jgi:hypothetical protein
MRATHEVFWLNIYSIISFVQSPRFEGTLITLVCTEPYDYCSTSAKQHNYCSSSLTYILCRKVIEARVFVHLARHAGLAEEIVANDGRAQQRRPPAHYRAHGFLRMQMHATAHEARMAEVNAVMDTTREAWEASEDEGERKAAEYYKHWSEKAGEALVWPVLLQSMSCGTVADLMCVILQRSAVFRHHNDCIVAMDIVVCLDVRSVELLVP